MVKRSSPASGNARKPKKEAEQPPEDGPKVAWGLSGQMEPHPDLKVGDKAKVNGVDSVFNGEEWVPDAPAEVAEELRTEEQSEATAEEQAPKTRRGGRKPSAENTASGDANSGVNLTNMTSDLVAGVERMERLAEEMSALKDDAKEVMGELKSKGYSTKMIRRVLMRRAMDPDKRKEEDHLLEIYEEALRGA